jgi:hypothetical protein
VEIRKADSPGNPFFNGHLVEQERFAPAAYMLIPDMTGQIGDEIPVIEL